MEQPHPVTLLFLPQLNALEERKGFVDFGYHHHSREDGAHWAAKVPLIHSPGPGQLHNSQGAE